MEKFIVYHKSIGIPEKIGFMDGKWWVLSRNALLEPLNNEMCDNEEYMNLCTLDEELSIKDLAGLMGAAWTCEEAKEDVKDILETRLNDLIRLGVKINAVPQQMDVTVRIVKSKDVSKRNPYLVSCFDTNDNWQDYFLMEEFFYPEAALMFAKDFLEFFKNHGVTIHATLNCTEDIHDELWPLANDMVYDEITD